MSVAEAVEGTPLAQLLKRADVGANRAVEQRQRQRQSKQALTLRSCIPQLSDLSDVDNMRCA